MNPDKAPRTVWWPPVQQAEKVQWARHGNLAPVEWVRWLAAGTMGGMIKVV